MDVSHAGWARARALLLAAFALPVAGHAATLSTLQVNQVQITGIPLTTVQQSRVSFGGTAQAAEASRDQVFTVNGTEFSIAAYGFASPEALRASATLSATSAATGFTSHLHFVNASVSDGLRIDSGLYNGQMARVTYTLDVSGMLDTSVVADGSPIAGANARWRVNSGCASPTQCPVGWIGLSQGYQGELSTPSPGFAIPFGDQPGPLSFTFEAAFGTEILLTYLLQVDTQLTFGNGSAGAFATATADFSNTVAWGGIQSVTLLDGTLVSDWTTTSGSGFDYGSASVIPVPAAAWLFGSALLGLAGLRLRRQAAPRDASPDRQGDG
jgi:hypothetical protein